MYMLAEFRDYRPYVNGDFSSYIKSYMNTLEKLKSPIRAAILWDFLNQEYQITIPKSQIQLAEKRKGEKQKALHSVMRFTQC